MNGDGKSDGFIVPGKPANKAVQRSYNDRQSAAELVEGRESTEGNSFQLPTTEIQGSDTLVSCGLERIRKAAGRDRRKRFTNLMCHITEPLLLHSYEHLNPRSVPGIDLVTWEAYGENVRARIADLKDRVHSGRYRARPSLRQYIPKPDGRQRPLGIAALEDKVVQQAVVTVLSQIYEKDFKGFSYGFRPGRSAHDALDALYVGVTERPIQWVIDADIQGFFDHVDHDWLERFLEHRIGDKRLLRLILKWLRAGVSDEGVWSATRQGTPQGAVISPLLANVYLHYVFDLWLDWWRREYALGAVIVVRYADDFVIGFQYERDARLCLAELNDRLQSFGLSLHQGKTRLIEFGLFARLKRQRCGEGKPASFDFLGFTHSCSATRRGSFCLRRKPIAKRMRAKLAAIKNELKRRRHSSVPEQGQWLRSVLRGWLNYYGVPLSSRFLNVFRNLISRMWFRSLRRRSQKARQKLWWPRMNTIVRRWLPPALVVHPWPSVRFAVNHPK